MRIVMAVIRREYVHRVRSKWFVIGTVAGPLLMIAISAVPIALGSRGDALDRVIVILDSTDALYESVTQYVQTEMGKADQLEGARKGSVGFALTSLQRRLASSPEAIYQSLQRRKERLENRLPPILTISRSAARLRRRSQRPRRGRPATAAR